ncbi:MAG: UDP-3-O-(3-hydroxymyristoyl)glucosamine N-acyltransferase [Saprospiraceae bacterium]
MNVTAQQLAHLLNGTLEGDPNASISKPARIEEAVAGDFAFLDNPKYEHYAYETQASVLLVSQDFKPSKPVKPTLVRVADVRSSLAILLQEFQNQAATQAEISDKAEIHTSAKLGANCSVGSFTIIEAGAEIGNNCTIHPQVYIGPGVRIGDNCTLFPGTRIHADCIIGNACILYANAVIGSDGFGYAPQPDGSWSKVPHVGNVVLEDHVEVGANSCIDRAAMGSTRIKSGAKIDNLVHIAHNVEVGSNTVMAAQVGIAGSAKIGDNCQLGGQTGIAGHISLANGTRTQAQSGLGSTVKEENQALFGSPAIDYRDYVKAYIVFKQLPEMQKKLRALEKFIETLKAENS